MSFATLGSPLPSRPPKADQPEDSAFPSPPCHVPITTTTSTSTPLPLPLPQLLPLPATPGHPHPERGCCWAAPDLGQVPVGPQVFPTTSTTTTGRSPQHLRGPGKTRCGAGGQDPGAGRGSRLPAPAYLLGADRGSSPAAERGEPRVSPVWSCCCWWWWCCWCRSASLRFPTDGLAFFSSFSSSSRPAALSGRGISSRDFYTGGREPDPPRFDSTEPGLRRAGERREARRAPGQSERPRCPLV